MSAADAKLIELLKPIAEDIAKNCGTAPQLTFPLLFLGVKDLLQNPEFTALSQAPAPVDGPAITERGRHHVAGLRSIREHHELSGDELTALTVAIAVMGSHFDDKA